MKEIYDILIRPLLTEKGTNLQESANVYLFEVHPNATKVEIKDAVEKVFNVRVERVRTMNILGKAKRFRRSLGRRRSWKKAYVTLKEGDTINFYGEL